MTASQLVPSIHVYARITLAAIGFALGFISFTYSTCSLMRLLNKFNDKNFDKEVKSIKTQSLGFYGGGFLYFLFFTIEFGQMWADKFMIELFIGILLLLLVSNFLNRIYILNVHR